MKKNWIIPFLVVVLIILTFNLWGATAEYRLYKNKIGVKLPKDSIIIVKDDSHGGFHGDGEYYSEIQSTESGLKEFIGMLIN
jgi:hypothetical protein